MPWPKFCVQWWLANVTQSVSDRPRIEAQGNLAPEPKLLTTTWLPLMMLALIVRFSRKFSDSLKVHQCFQIHWTCTLKTGIENIAVGAFFIPKRHIHVCYDNSIHLIHYWKEYPCFSCQISVVLFRISLSPSPNIQSSSLSSTNSMQITFFKQEGVKRHLTRVMCSKVVIVLATAFQKGYEKIICKWLPSLRILHFQRSSL